MWPLRVFVKCVLFGAFGGPMLGFAFFEFETEGFSWAATKAWFIGNMRLAAVFAAIGATIGAIVGIVKIVKGERDVSLV